MNIEISPEARECAEKIQALHGGHGPHSITTHAIRHKSEIIQLAINAAVEKALRAACAMLPSDYRMVYWPKFESLIPQQPTT